MASYGMLWSDSIQEAGKLIVAGMGAVALLSLNLIMTIVSLLFIDSKEWKNGVLLHILYLW
ncbi:MAG: hypothetical protein COZ18_09830 [Flexibacter sp. CG_4_10_14_3_um_filter_32_15]|nr:MAG: hypothetical protein COZ18_09830 [Flexibacter sp. CG_4_10_14_3_um_filter_32_15]